MERSMVDACRRLSEDVKEEIRELELWQDEVDRREEAKKMRKLELPKDEVTVPIRGTVPSLKTAVSNAPKKASTAPNPIDIAKEKGNEYFRVGKVDDAIHAYTSGIDLDPGSASTHILYGNRAMCYIKLKKWASAESDATICLQMNRGYAKGYFRRAIARKNLGNLTGARSDLESVLALVPNDSSATEELEVVRRMIKAQSEGQVNTKAPSKKIAIEEVEEEDDDEGNEEPPNKKDCDLSESAEQRTARETRIEKELAELQSIRMEKEMAAKAEAALLEKKMEMRRKNNTRVEIIEEEETNVAPAKKAPQPDTRISSVDTEADAAVSAKVKEVKKEKVSPTAATNSAGGASSAAEATAAPHPSKQRDASKLQELLQSRILPTKESLEAPKSFTEFEKMISRISNEDELRDYYISLMDPARIPDLFGSNITPKILTSILKSVQKLSGKVAFRYLKGLSQVRRIENIALFLNSDEKQLVEDTLQLVRTSGIPEKELAAVKGKLKPL